MENLSKFLIDIIVYMFVDYAYMYITMIIACVTVRDTFWGGEGESTTRTSQGTERLAGQVPEARGKSSLQYMYM